MKPIFIIGEFLDLFWWDISEIEMEVSIMALGGVMSYRGGFF